MSPQTLIQIYSLAVLEICTVVSDPGESVKMQDFTSVHPNVECLLLGCVNQGLTSLHLLLTSSRFSRLAPGQSPEVREIL